METTRKTVIEVDYREVERVIREYYYQPGYDIVADEEWNNDTQHVCEVFPVERDPIRERQVDEFIATGDGSFKLGYLLDNLCVAGRIEPGHYLITISW